MPITLTIIAVTCLVSFLAFRSQRLMSELLLWPSLIKRKQEYYRLVTYGFVHADIGHLIFNMLTLFFFGRKIEVFYAQVLGPLGFPLFYLSALLVSVLPSCIKNRDNPGYRSLGASGAVSAVLFAFILLAPWSRIVYFGLPIPAVIYALLYVGYSIYMDRWGGDNINHSAHLWGAAYGVLFTLVAWWPALGYFLSAVMQPWR